MRSLRVVPLLVPLCLVLLVPGCARVPPPPPPPSGDVLFSSPRVSGGQGAEVTALVAGAPDFFALGDFSGELSWGVHTRAAKGGQDVFVARVEPTGTVRWLRRLGGPGEDVGDALALVGADLVAVGMFARRADVGEWALEGQGEGDCFVVRLAREDGRVVWARSYGGRGTLACRAVVADAAGDLFVTGRFEGEVVLGGERMRSAGLNDTFLLKLSGVDGSPRWARHFGGAGEDVGRDVAVTPSGTVLLTGLFSQGASREAGGIDFGTGQALVSEGDADAFLAAFSPRGEVLWARRFGGPAYDQAKSVVVTPEGTLCLTGLSQRGDAKPGTDGTLFSAGGFEGFLLGVSPEGIEQWRHTWPAMTSGHALALAPWGEVLLTGHFAGTLRLGPGLALESHGEGDLLVAGFTPAGAPRWARHFGGQGQDYGYAVAATARDVVVGGVMGRSAVLVRLPPPPVSAGARAGAREAR